MICSVCAIGLHYLILKFLSVNLFLWGHELANSFLLFSVHKSFLQIIKNFSLRHRLHFLLILLHLVQPPMGLKCENKPWQEISGHYRQMLSPKSPVAQDLQQTHAQAQLLVHAEYENHHLNPQQKDPFTRHCNTGTHTTTRTNVQLPKET